VTPGLDRMFHALGDPTRLGIVERLSRGPASVSELAGPLDMALPSVMKHLRVLEEGRLVRSTKTGRVRSYRIEPRAFEAIDRWVARRRATWSDRFDRLDAMLADDDPTETKRK
jgi:DNA-binding transcriptional ArsR family regulator